MLYKKLAKPNASQTQLFYKLQYWPATRLSDKAKLLCHSRRAVMLPKHVLLDCMNKELTHIYMPNFAGALSYRIVWAYNNIPTEQEWDKKSGNYLISVEFRTFVHCQHEPVAIFSFGYCSDELAYDRDCKQLQQLRQLQGEEA